MDEIKHHDVNLLTKRINKIEGQLKGISKMIIEDKPCDEIIIQLNSAKSAIQKISQMILEDHLNHCVLDAIKQGKGEEQIESLKIALNQFSKII